MRFVLLLSLILSCVNAVDHVKASNEDEDGEDWRAALYESKKIYYQQWVNDFLTLIEQGDTLQEAWQCVKGISSPVHDIDPEFFWSQLVPQYHKRYQTHISSREMGLHLDFLADLRGYLWQTGPIHKGTGQQLDVQKRLSALVAQTLARGLHSFPYPSVTSALFDFSRTTHNNRKGKTQKVNIHDIPEQVLNIAADYCKQYCHEHSLTMSSLDNEEDIAALLSHFPALIPPIAELILKSDQALHPYAHKRYIYAVLRYIFLNEDEDDEDNKEDEVDEKSEKDKKDNRDNRGQREKIEQGDQQDKRDKTDTTRDKTNTTDKEKQI
jgi:hypothetical protein